VRQAGRCHDERNPQRLFEERVLAQQAPVLAEVEAVVAHQDDDRVPPPVVAVESVEHEAHLRVGERDAGLVRGDRLPA
jgi:hypothetical protein